MVSILMIRNMVKVYILGQMVNNMMVAGKMENNTVEQNSQIHKDFPEKVNGKVVSV